MPYSIAHIVCTGVTNEAILENARRIYHDLKLPIIIRVPVVPGCNDSLENMERLGDFVANELGHDVEVHLLPYHRLGIGKSEQLEKEPQLKNVKPPEQAHIETLRASLRGKNLRVGE